MSEPRSISIAIVDDDGSVRVGLRRLCTVLGMRVSVYASAREFLEGLDSGAGVDCLLLDAHMPEMTGLELQRHLLARGVRIPAIVFTADDAPELSLPNVPAGIVACLSKPVSAEDLLSAIRRAVSAGEQPS